jgi:hypothetical protein
MKTPFKIDWKALARIFFALLIITFLFSVYKFTRQTEHVEIFIFSAENYLRGKPVSVLLFARDGADQMPLRGRDIEVSIDCEMPFKIRTRNDGTALLVLKEYPKNDFTVKACIGKQYARKDITLRPEWKCMLTCDKPVYKPGQTIRMRTLTLNAVNQHPAKRIPVKITVNDSRNNMVFSKDIISSEFGIAACDFELAEQINTGKYTISADTGKEKVSKTVEVKNYRLPDFKVKLQTDKPFYAPGDTVSGTVEGRYLWDKPLSETGIEIKSTLTFRIPDKGNESIFGGNEPHYVRSQVDYKTITGRTSTDGRLKFKFKLPEEFSRIDFNNEDSICELSVSASSSDGLKQKLTKELIITNHPVRIDYLPEFPTLLPKYSNNIYISVSDPVGRPLDAAVKTEFQSVQTDKNGLALLKMPPGVHDPLKAVVKVRSQDKEIIKEIPLNYDERPAAFILKTDRSVYKPGDKMQLGIISNQAAGTIFINIVKNNKSLNFFPLELSGGKAGYEFKIPEYIFGTIQIHAYRILPQGNIIRDLRLVQINRPDKLLLKTTFDKKSYLPGTRAQINFQVSDADGTPVQAALSIAAVDEAVFAYKAEDTVSQRIYFLLQEEVLKAKYQMRAGKLCASPPLSQQEAGFILANSLRINNLEVNKSSSYANRVNSLIRQKIEYGEKLFSILLPVLFGIFLGLLIYFIRIWFIPGRKSYYLIISPELQRKSRNNIFIAISGFVILTLLLLVILDLINGITLNMSKVEMLITNGVITFCSLLYLTVLGFMLYRSFKVRNLLLEPASESGGKVQNSIAVAPYLSLIYILLVHFFWIVKVFFPNIMEWNFIQGLFWWFMPLSAIWLFAASSIRGFMYTREEYDAMSGLIGLGTGLGTYPNPFGKAWIWLVLSSYFVIVAFYILLGIMVFSMFLPFCKIIEKLGGSGGGYSGFSYSPPYSLSDSNEYFSLNSEQAAKSPFPWVRRLFPETLCWEPELITDKNGCAFLKLNVADSISNYRFAVSAVTRDGLIADDSKQLKAFQDLFINFRVPENLSAGDIVSFPVSLHNYTLKPQKLSVSVDEDKAFSVLSLPEARTLAPQTMQKVYVTLKFTQAGKGRLRLSVQGAESGDTIEREFQVAPSGKKVTVRINGKLQKNSSDKFTVPDNAVFSGDGLCVKIYSRLVDKASDTLAGILRKPNGCFEQTTSAAYPDVMVLKYLKNSPQPDPESIAKAYEYISLGYQRMLKFEVPSGGFSWYGDEPPKLLLSAYGLMALHDMQEFLPVDKAVIKRTADYLKRKRNPDHSWKDWRSTLETTAYIAMALKNCASLDNELILANKYILEHIDACKDPYTLALCANALPFYEQEKLASVLKRLYEMRSEDSSGVYWKSRGKGTFYSVGTSLDIETTALVISAMMEKDLYPYAVGKAVEWLSRQKLGMTSQACVFSLRALLKYQEYRKVSTPAVFNVTANLNQQSKTITINCGKDKFRQYLSFDKGLRKGENTVSIKAVDGGFSFYQLEAVYHLPWKVVSADSSNLKLNIDYDKKVLRVGDSVNCRFSIENKDKFDMPMGIVTVPVPVGFEVIPDSLEALRKTNIIDSFSLDARRAVLYFKAFRRGRPTSFELKFKAIYPVEINTPTAEAYPYYQPENITSSRPQKIIVRQNR